MFQTFPNHQPVNDCWIIAPLQDLDSWTFREGMKPTAVLQSDLESPKKLRCWNLREPRLLLTHTLFVAVPISPWSWKVILQFGSRHFSQPESLSPAKPRHSGLVVKRFLRTPTSLRSTWWRHHQTSARDQGHPDAQHTRRHAKRNKTAHVRTSKYH